MSTHTEQEGVYVEREYSPALPLRTNIGRNILSYLDGYYEGQRDARLTPDPLVPVDKSHFGAGYTQGVEDYRRGIQLVLRP